MNESLITEELLADIDATYQQHFKKEVFFEWPIMLQEITERSDFDACMMPTLQQKERYPHKPFAAVTAEMHISHHLGWQSPIVNPPRTQLEELMSFITKSSAIQQKKIWLYSAPLTRGDLEACRPYVEGVASLIGTLNREIYRRMFPSIPFTEHLAMFDDATKFKRGIVLLLGLGESLQDIKTLHDFISSNDIKKVVLIPVTPSKYSPYSRPPSSFVVARWIAEARIAFPTIEIVVGTTADRAAEVSLFLKAGANGITKFSGIRLFNTDAAKVVEEEVKNADRSFVSTLTNAHRLKSMRQMLTKAKESDAVKLRAEKYMELMQSQQTA